MDFSLGGRYVDKLALSTPKTIRDRVADPRLTARDGDLQLCGAGVGRTEF